MSRNTHFSTKGVSLVLLKRCQRGSELRRILIPRTPVNNGNWRAGAYFPGPRKRWQRCLLLPTNKYSNP
jgi:hypothetical protein